MPKKAHNYAFRIVNQNTNLTLIKHVCQIALKLMIIQLIFIWIITAICVLINVFLVNMLITIQDIAILIVPMDYGQTIQLEDVSLNVPVLLIFMDIKKFVIFCVQTLVYMLKIPQDNVYKYVHQEVLQMTIINDAWIYAP